MGLTDPTRRLLQRSGLSRNAVAALANEVRSETLKAASTRTEHTVVDLDEVHIVKRNNAGDDLYLDLPPGSWLLFNKIPTGAAEAGWAGIGFGNAVFELPDEENEVLPGFNGEDRLFLADNPGEDRITTKFGGEVVEVPNGKVFRVKMVLYVYGTWFGTVGGGDVVPAGIVNDNSLYVPTIWAVRL